MSKWISDKLEKERKGQEMQEQERQTISSLASRMWDNLVATITRDALVLNANYGLEIKVKHPSSAHLEVLENTLPAFYIHIYFGSDEITIKSTKVENLAEIGSDQTETLYFHLGDNNNLYAKADDGNLDVEQVSQRVFRPILESRSDEES